MLKSLRKAYSTVVRAYTGINHLDVELMLATRITDSVERFKKMDELIEKSGGLEHRDTMGRTVLMCEVLVSPYKSKEIALANMRHLIKKGADINALDKLEGAVIRMSVIDMAAFHDNAEAVQLLIENGVDPDKQSGEQGTTPLSYAAQQNSIKAIEAFLNGGADIDVVDKHGFTPLMNAAWFGSTDAVQHLIERGANLMPMTPNGLSPLEHALAHGHIAAAGIIEQAMLKKSIPIPSRVLEHYSLSAA